MIEMWGGERKEGGEGRREETKQTSRIEWTASHSDLHCFTVSHTESMCAWRLECLSKEERNRRRSRRRERRKRERRANIRVSGCAKRKRKKEKRKRAD